jgi:hypothetical protein
MVGLSAFGANHPTMTIRMRYRVFARNDKFGKGLDFSGGVI